MITFEIIKQRLLADGYADWQTTDDTVSRLLSLKGKAHDLLAEWIELGKKPKFESIDGVDSEFLSQKLHMKDAAVIIAYAMLLNDTKENVAYFKHLADNIIGFYPTNK